MPAGTKQGPKQLDTEHHDTTLPVKKDAQEYPPEMFELRLES